MSTPPPLRFAAIGLNHGHIYMQTDILLDAGAQLVSYFAIEPELAAAYGRQYPQAARAASAEAILEDPSIQLIINAGIPCERAPLGIRAMQHGKDYMTDKPGMTTFAQLAEVRRVQAETGRIYSVDFSERFHVRSAVKAGELIRAGAIGQVLQVTILAPHRAQLASRPTWFFERAKYGGILVDIGSHQFDQILFYTGSDRAEVVAAQVGNLHHPDHPELEDFGDALIRGSGGFPKGRTAEATCAWTGSPPTGWARGATAGCLSSGRMAISRPASTAISPGSRAAITCFWWTSAASNVSTAGTWR